MKKFLMLISCFFLLSVHTHAQSASSLTMEEVLELAQEVALNDGVAEGEEITGLTKEEVLDIAKKAVLAEGDIPEEWFSNDATVRFYSDTKQWDVMFIARDGNEMIQNLPVNFIDVSISFDGSIGILKSH